ncbi:hypothetical protein [Nocardioides sp. R-C-SC26]|uniref:hypothetical protein n=1 Tax=Nocardioides sp. R-C-SC26 TaxID=2870414 RepID=UPI001E35D3C6|nr:hypothetical protein [Nocardioides sp. R-C-SC26]
MSTDVEAAPTRRGDGPRGGRDAAARAAALRARVEMFAASSWPFRIAAGVLVLGVVTLALAAFDLGPAALAGGGAVAVTSTFAWALAARTGGRPVLFGGLALVLGTIAASSDSDLLRSGAALAVAVLAAVLGVMATVPAVRFVAAVRETLLALAIAAVGAMAVVGFSPAIEIARFEYATFGLALAGALTLVYRLGAGLHGLGRRGVVIVIVGGALLALTVLYAELLRRYGESGLVSSMLDVVGRVREDAGAFPRPVMSVLGVPALLWGCHMRARRRQGWWVCVFGVAGTVPVANALINPDVALSESVLAVAYGLGVGVLIGYAIIRIDVAFTGSRPRGRRSRVAEEATAVRPEPPRTAALL